MKWKKINIILLSLPVFTPLIILSCNSIANKLTEFELHYEKIKQKYLKLNEFKKDFINNLTENHEIKLRVLINEITGFFNQIITSIIKLSNSWSSLPIPYNQGYLNKFHLTIKTEKNIMINLIKNSPKNQIITVFDNEFKKLDAYQITMKNYLYNAYKASSNFKTISHIENWDIVKLKPAVYNYYRPILNKTSNELIQGLHTLLKQTMNPKFKNKNIEIEKRQNYHNLWELFKTLGFKDIEWNKEHTILDIYSKNPIGKDAFNYTEKHQQKSLSVKKAGDTYNREHLIPKSHFFEKSPMYYDAHHIWPSDAWTNSKRSNYHHGIVLKPNKTKFVNGAKLGTNHLNKVVFEPDDAFKGDIARAYLYFAIRYYDVFNNFKQETTSFFTNRPFIKEPQLSIMLDWHENLDRVDMIDLNRNQAIFEFQGNRNPFVDLPSLSKLIWDSKFKNTPLVFNV